MAGSFPAQGHPDYILITDAEPVDLGPASRPDEIYLLDPNEGGESCRKGGLRVQIQLNDQMRTDGVADLSKVSLLVDGKDVTRESSASGTVDRPQSLLELMYEYEKMKVGRHRAALRYQEPTGRASTYRWNFEVKRDQFKANGIYWPCFAVT